MIAPCRSRPVFRLALLLLLLGSGVACQRELPSPWKEMHFPLSNAEIMPGADATGFHITYPGMGQQADLFREYQSALERGGYAFEKNTAHHDPTTGSHGAIHKKGEERVQLTVSGERSVEARVTTSVD